MAYVHDAWATETNTGSDFVTSVEPRLDASCEGPQKPGILIVGVDVCHVGGTTGIVGPAWSTTEL